MTQRIILIRHGSRIEGSFDEDVGLSAQGRYEVGEATKLIAPLISHNTFLFSSPKYRTLETVQIISEAFGKSYEIDPRLDEKKSSESAFDFRLRIESFFAEKAVQIQLGLSVAVTHSDWLEAAQFLYFSQLPPIFWKTAAPVLFEVQFPNFKRIPMGIS